MSQNRRRGITPESFYIVYSTSAYTLQPDETLLINGSAAGAHTLPALIGLDEPLVTVRVKNVGSGNVTVAATGTDTIDGLSTLVLAPNDFATLVADQTDRPGEWFIF